MTKNYQMQLRFIREKLPTPITYYTTQFVGLKCKSEWAKIRCCFHNDTRPSLSISMINGHFKCHACGAKGCDVLAFHMKRYKLKFPQAVTELGAWADE